MTRPEVKVMRRGDEMILGARIDARNMQDLRATVSQVRELVLSWRVAGPDFSEQLQLPPIAAEFAPTQQEVEMVSSRLHDAVSAGRFIDLGNIPNAVLKFGGDRGGALWNAGALGMPFGEAWLLYHSWEAGVSVYMVNPISDAEFEVAELNPVQVGNSQLLLIGDRGFFMRHQQSLHAGEYDARIAPAQVRYAAGAPNNGGTPESAAAGNIGDPVMAALLMLNTRNIEVETVRVSEKLQKARAKNRKPPIPSYEKVLTEPYVTAVLARGSRRPRGADLGGTHRSPVAHIRMGHPRTYASGQSIFIRDTLVNVPPEQRAVFKSQRTHYEVR